MKADLEKGQMNIVKEMMEKIDSLKVTTEF